MEEVERFWIAINGTSCSLSRTPWKNPVTIPVARQYKGFPSVEEAEEAQRLCLEGSEAEMEAFFEEMQPAVKAGRIRVINPPYPQSPTEGPTAWMESKDAPVIVPAYTSGETQN